MIPLDILYVDDDADIRHIVGLSLALDPAISLRVAASAAEAILLVDQGGPPDVALLDVMMPGTNGLTLLAQLRARADTAGVAVIFMTARGRLADAELYREKGAAGMILKPFDPLDLAARIRAIVDRGADQDG